MLGALTVTAAENTRYADPAARPADGPVSLAFSFDAPGRSIAYTGDTGPSPAVERLARGVDLLVSEMIDMAAQAAVVWRAFAGRPAAQVAEVVDYIGRQHLSPEQVGARRPGACRTSGRHATWPGHAGRGAARGLSAADRDRL